MGETTKIPWADHSWNAWRGCRHAILPDGTEHPGCANCYAEAMSKRNPAVMGEWGESGRRVVSAEKSWEAVKQWNKRARKAGRMETVFPHLCDPFEDWRGVMHDVSGFIETRCGNCYDRNDCKDPQLGCHQDPLGISYFRERFFGLIDDTPDLRWLLLTKRPQNVRQMLPFVEYHACFTGDCPHDRASDCNTEDEQKHRDNVWLLYSASDQASLDARADELLACRDLCAGVGLSLEPLVGPIDNLRKYLLCEDCITDRGETYDRLPDPCDGRCPKIQWIIVGGESGHHRRTMEIEWLESIAEQCEAAGVPLYVKQDAALKSDQQGRIPDRLWSRKEYPWSK